MEKLSSTKVAQLLHDAETALRSVTSERDHAVEKLAQLQRRRDAEKLAAEMHGKGIHLDKSFGDLSDDLEKSAESGELSIIQRAVDMMAPNMGLSTATLTSDETKVASGASEFERYLFGAIG